MPSRTLVRFAPALVCLGALAVLTACQGNPLEVTRSFCPAVAVVKHANALTRFSGPVATAENVAYTAQFASVSSDCVTRGPTLTTRVQAVITAQRTSTDGPDTLTLPYFITVVRGGDQVVAKDIRMAQLSFPPGSLTGTASVTAEADVDEATARQEAAPLQTRDARGNRIIVERTTAPTGFEVLLGFQLAEADAAYNVRR